MNKDKSRLEKAIFSDAKAKNCYDELILNGLKSTDLLMELISLAIMAAEEKPTKRRSVSGKTPKTVAYFPARLKTIAEEVEKLNDDPLYTPNDKEYMALPEILLGYAKQLQERRQLLKRSRKGRPGQMGQALHSIRWLAQRETGRENCALLKHILAAARRDSDFDFEAALKTNAHRYPL